MTITELPALKKIVSLLVVALCSSLLIPIVSAQSARADSPVFTTSDSLGGTVKITGCDANCSGDLVIPDTIAGKTVTSIGVNALQGKGLTSVSIPSSVTSIGDGAFYDNLLTSVSIPSSVTSIGNYVFHINRLTSVSIPSSVTSIGNYAFSRNQLTSVSIPSSVMSIGVVAFGFNQITSVSIPSSVTNIDFGAFYSNKLTSVSIPSSITSIGAYVFYNNRLTSVSIPSSVTSIDSHAFFRNELTSVTFLGDAPSDGGDVFSENPSFTSVVVPSNAVGFGLAFYGATVSYAGDPIQGKPIFTTSENNDGTITITGCSANCSDDLVIPGAVTGKTVTSIGTNAFQAKSLTSVTIANSVTSIGNRAFMQNSIQSVTLSRSVTSIGAYAFYNNQITSVTIPSSVTSIGAYAFYNNQISSVTFLGDGPPDDGTIFVNHPGLPSVVVPSDAIGFGDTFSTIPVVRSGAAFHHTVTYSAAGGSAVTQGSFTTGGSIQTAPVSTRAGYTLSGWSATESGSVVTFPYSPTEISGITLYAIWSANTNAVTYSAAGGSAVTQDSFTTGGSIQTAPVSTRAGYTLTGWSETESGSVVSFPYSPTATSDITLYAIWNANTNTVTYNAAGGSAVTSGSFTSGGSIQTAPVSTRAGYTLSGWSETESGSVVTFPYSPTATTDITLYAIWVLIPVKATYVTGAKVNGTAKVGKTVSAVTGSWNGTASVAYTYQWYSCQVASKKVLTTGKAAAKCSAIKKETKSTFKVTAKVKGTFLAVLITGTNRVGKTTIFTNTIGKVS